MLSVSYLWWKKHFKHFIITKPRQYQNKVLLIIMFFDLIKYCIQFTLFYGKYISSILHVLTTSNLMVFGNLVWLFKYAFRVHLKYLVSKKHGKLLKFWKENRAFFIETMSKISAISSFVHKSIIPPSPRSSYLAVRSANMRVEILVILCIKKVMTAKKIISQNCTTYVPWSPNKVIKMTLDLKIVIVYKHMCWI